MKVAVGTSGYSYKEWKGSFYPPDLPADRMLSYYARQFPTVEINNTFYRLPSESMLLEWATQVPERFTFAIKASRRITHDRRLQDVGDLVDYLVRNVSVLGTRRGPLLFQLPPNLKKDLPRLEAFTSLLPAGWSIAIESRHPSWFADDVYEHLRSRGIALVTSEQEDENGAASLVPTTDWGYLRLHRQGYGEAELHAWAERVRAQPWTECFVYFKHEEDIAGPAVAEAFRSVLGAAATA